MRSRKFFEADLADTKPAGPRGRAAFGADAHCRTKFGRDSSPHFGSLLRADERGVALVEYALICALIAVAVVAGVGTLGGGVNQTWSNVDHQVNDATTYTTN